MISQILRSMVAWQTARALTRAVNRPMQAAFSRWTRLGEADRMRHAKVFARRRRLGWWQRRKARSAMQMARWLGAPGDIAGVARQYLGPTRHKVFEQRQRAATADYAYQMKEYENALARGDTSVQKPIFPKINAPRDIPVPNAGVQTLMKFSGAAAALATALGAVGIAGAGALKAVSGVVAGSIALYHYGRYRTEANAPLARYNAQISSAYADLGGGRYSRNFAFAAMTADTASDLARQQNSAEASLLQFNADIANMKNMVGSQGSALGNLWGRVWKGMRDGTPMRHDDEWGGWYGLNFDDPRTDPAQTLFNDPAVAHLQSFLNGAGGRLAGTSKGQNKLGLPLWQSSLAVQPIVGPVPTTIPRHPNKGNKGP